MRAVDTNVLVRLIARDDASQLAAAQEFIAHGAWVSQLVLAETVWVLSSAYGLGPRAIADTVEMLLNHKLVIVESPEVVTEALAAFRKHPALGFFDCYLLELTRRSGHLPMGTFDRQLAKLAGTVKL